MKKVNGIAEEIIDVLVDRSNLLRQGRSVGAFGLVNEEGCVDRLSAIVDGGINGLPFRQLLSKVVSIEGLSLVESIELIPDDAVVISTSPGKAGLIVSTGGINIFNIPIMDIGIKGGSPVGVGILYPEAYLFDLATESERVQIELLEAKSIQEEKRMLRDSAKLRLTYLDISQELPVVKTPLKEGELCFQEEAKNLFPRLKVKSLAKELAQEMIETSLSVEQGREVACFGFIDDQGHVTKGGEIVIGGMGYVPSRLLASSITDIAGLSLREVYIHKIPSEVAIVHTHSGGTGVMHMGDAMAGPGTWGRPIIAIGHDKDGEIRGATAIEVRPEVQRLADEHEELSQNFYEVESSKEEADLRKRQFGIAQEYTDLCEPIEIR